MKSLHQVKGRHPTLRLGFGRLCHHGHPKDRYGVLERGNGSNR